MGKREKVVGFKRKMSQLWVSEKVRAFTSVQVATRSDLSAFAVGDQVRITGCSKGKGFTGVVKRYHFRGGPATHGQSDRERAAGSIGSTTTPGRVLKGKRMAGRSGSKTVSRTAEVLSIDETEGSISFFGPLPGPRGGRVLLRKITKV